MSDWLETTWIEFWLNHEPPDPAPALNAKAVYQAGALAALEWAAGIAASERPASAYHDTATTAAEKIQAERGRLAGREGE